MFKNRIVALNGFENLKVFEHQELTQVEEKMFSRTKSLKAQQLVRNCKFIVTVTLHLHLTYAV